MSYVENLEQLTQVPKRALSTRLFDVLQQHQALADAYYRQQHKALLASQGKPHRQLGAMAKISSLLAAQPAERWPMLLTRLLGYPRYAAASELFAQLILNQAYLAQAAHTDTTQHKDGHPEPIDERALPFVPSAPIKPLSAKLVRALQRWPDDERLFAKALHHIERQPALVTLLCRHATAYTAQNKVLAPKSALLLLGPDRARDLLLLSHFESHLTKPLFPLRSAVLQRRALIAGMLHSWSQCLDIALPCRAELLSYFLIYDAWHHPVWCTAQRFEHQAQANSGSGYLCAWLQSEPTFQHRQAHKLSRYWQLSAELTHALAQLSQPSTAADTPQVHLLRLSIAAVDYVQHGFSKPLQKLLTAHGALTREYYQDLVQANCEMTQYCSIWPPAVRP